MKKKTKERLDRIEKRLQQLMEDVQDLKGPTHGKESVKDRDLENTDASKDLLESARKTLTTRAKKVATKKAGKPKKAVAAKKVVMAKKAKQAAPGTPTAKKTVKKLAPNLAKQKVVAEPQRPTKAKPAAKSAKSAPTIAPKSRLKMTNLMMPKRKASVAPAAVVPEPKTVASRMLEAGQSAKFEVEPPQPELEDKEELVEDIDDVSEEIEEEVEEELGLDSQDDDVDYLEKSEDLLDDTEEYRNN